MKMVIILLCLVLSLQWGLVNPSALAISPAQPPESVAKPDLSTPQKTVEAFFAALNRMDLRAMVPCVLEALDTPTLEQLQKAFTRNNPLPGKMVPSDIRVYKNETGLDALVSFELETPEVKSEQVMLVRKTGDVWKIVAPNPRIAGSGNSPDPINIEDTRSAKEIALIVRYPDAFLAGHAKLIGRASLSNVTRIALGLTMYAVDHEDTLIPNAAKLKETLLPYIKLKETLNPLFKMEESVFTSPLDPVGTVSYKFNPQLVGKSPLKLAVPSRTVMVFEGEYKKLLFRYSGRAIVGFADGDAELVTPEEAKKLHWTP